MTAQSGADGEGGGRRRPASRRVVAISFFAILLGAMPRRGAAAEPEQKPGEEVELSPAAALGVFVPTFDRVVLAIELRGDPSMSPALAFASGALVHPSPDVELGLALQVGLSESNLGGILTATWETDLAGDSEEARRPFRFESSRAKRRR
jgi:hypothetical protein